MAPVFKSPFNMPLILPHALPRYMCLPSTKTTLNIFEAFKELWPKFSQRFKLIAFFILGLIFTILHHFLRNYLSGRPVSSVVSFRLSFPSQSIVGMLSNALSELVKWLLISTINIAYAQYFWRATRRYHNPQDWHHLNALLAAANGNPFTISAFPMWCHWPRLACSAFMMMSMVYIPIFVPGAI